MTDPGDIRIADFNYPLPSDRIAQFPVSERDGSRLLVFQKDQITQDRFLNISGYLPENSLLVFNDTKVIRARLFFTTQTGAKIEIFCLEPISPSAEVQSAFQQQAASTWRCLVGNLKRWKSGSLIRKGSQEGIYCELHAERIKASGDGSFEIAFSWDPPECSFSEILNITGLIPLPPYINRPPEPMDTDRYQTIYAARDGSVAAPTAGLHFTDSLLQKLREKGIKSEKVTLHVGLGTFRPVSAEHIRDHVMHEEKIIVQRKTIEWILDHPQRPVFAVGTTSARTLESLYWLGTRLIREGNALQPVVTQWDPYQNTETGKITVEQSLNALYEYLKKNKMEEFSGETQMMIVPGYEYRILSGLITNFHMPQSTLLLLVAALIGERWKEVYNYALSNDFRFLSYGDSCLFFNSERKSH